MPKSSLVQDESSLPLQSAEPLASHPLHMSPCVCCPPQHFGYDGSQGTGYQVSHQAFASFAAFIHGSNQNQQYHAFLTADYDMNMFDCHDPISYQATTNKKNDQDLPTYFEALTGPGCEAFDEAMGQEI